MCDEKYYKAQNELVTLIQDKDDYDIIDIIETVSNQHNISRDLVEEMYSNLYPNQGGSSMNTKHYHHIHTLQGVKDRAIRIAKSKSTKSHMFHNVEGYDLITFSFCHDENKWILIGYDVNDNIVEIFTS